MSPQRGFVGRWSPRAETRALLDHVDEVLSEYADQLPLTLRQIIYEVIVHLGNSGPWVALPARVVIDKDGAVGRKLVNSKPDYQRILEWRSRGLGDQFSAAVIKLLLRDHPSALSGAGQ